MLYCFLVFDLHLLEILDFFKMEEELMLPQQEQEMLYLFLEMQLHWHNVNYGRTYYQICTIGSFTDMLEKMIIFHLKFQQKIFGLIDKEKFMTNYQIF
ncbi:unnamed protein product [Paramecium pentaurelia]|uniref:Uncharacterized protein n=1 Tax=Paramecium pentaurelia TaxID=43138 RepID=A0A8S1SA42_9CILI|nr:unnamed protein product [Paramecium pentaurelia]